MINQLFALGLHRKQYSVSDSHKDLIEMECGKRVFWSAYTIDKYLSSALGRPQMIHDEDCDQVSTHEGFYETIKLRSLDWG